MEKAFTTVVRQAAVATLPTRGVLSLPATEGWGTSISPVVAAGAAGLTFRCRARQEPAEIAFGVAIGMM
jgi:hypothetical protein